MIFTMGKIASVLIFEAFMKSTHYFKVATGPVQYFLQRLGKAAFTEYERII